MIVGILGMQGNLEEHIVSTIKAFEALGIDGSVTLVRDKDDLARTDCLIISGGESTTMWKLLKQTNLFGELEKYDKPIFGTCAGMILLSKSGKKDSEKTGQEFLGRVDAVINRNAFGRQKDSFSTKIDFDGKPFEAVFIRAPVIESIGPNVEILAKYNNKIVAAKQGNIFVTAFHPELTNDSRIHEYFLKL
jgi:5'-phosphate synthase pdxT subunit